MCIVLAAEITIFLVINVFLMSFVCSSGYVRFYFCSIDCVVVAGALFHHKATSAKVRFV